MSSNAIRYVRLGYVALNVDDLDRSAAFYETVVGLQRVDAPAGVVLFRCSDRHHDIALYQGVPGLKRVAWQVEDDVALEAVSASLAVAGIEPSAVQSDMLAALGASAALRIAEPTTGATFEFFVASPDSDHAFTPTHTQIARLGHLVLASPDVAASEAFMTQTLNFRVSDRIDGVATFMRCFPNPLHHSFGIGPARDGQPMLQHVNFMVTEIDDIGRALNRFKQHDVPIVFGPGRHPTSDSVFLYFLDPDGLTLEYSYGMEEFPETGDRPPRAFDRALESVDSWGGRSDRAFGRVGAIDRSAA
jgi:2,3-dihydroxy-p-cumate/2,3-dihydroxybenzoate 3,4-dioxygenase